MYNARTDHYKKSADDIQLVGGVEISVPSTGEYELQPDKIRSRWQYLNKTVNVVENGVEQALKLDYRVFGRKASNVTQGDILTHPKTGLDYLVHTCQPIDGYSSATDHYEIEVSLYAVGRSQ